MLSYFQALDGLQSEVMLSHIRRLKPTLHYSQIGEPFLYRNSSITHSGGTHLKDLSSTRNGVSPDAESASVVTLSNIFDSRRRFYGFLRFYFCHIAFDSSVIDIPRTSKLPR